MVLRIPLLAPRSRAWLFWFTISLCACVGSTTGPSKSTSAAGSGDILPASAAGTSSESAPGVPDDFTGTISESLPISPQVQQAIDEANELSSARNPPGQSRLDRGLGAVPMSERPANIGLPTGAKQ